MRIIRSQDKKVIIIAQRIDNIYLNLNQERPYRISVWQGSDYRTLASYKSESTAMQVLDMLADWLVNSDSLDSIIRRRFQMPEDAEPTN